MEDVKAYTVESLLGCHLYSRVPTANEKQVNRFVPEWEPFWLQAPTLSQKLLYCLSGKEANLES